MKKFISLLLVMLLICLAPFALADGDTTITVQGAAQLTSLPDMLTLTANASVTAETVGEAQASLSAIIDQAIQKLLALGVADVDIVTQNYSYYPIYNSDATAHRTVTYQANHTLNVACRDVEQLDAVLSAITEAGVNEVYSVQFDLSNRSELYQQALLGAMQVARAKAEAMAEADGLVITGVESMTENQGYADYGMSGVAREKAMDTAAGANIRSGNVAVTASVTMTFAAEMLPE